MLCQDMQTFFFHPIYYPRTTLALSPSSILDPGSHSGPPFPPPHYGTRLHSFIARKSRHFFCLVDSRRLVRTHAARRSQQLILFSHFCKHIQNLTAVGIELKDQR